MIKRHTTTNSGGGGDYVSLVEQKEYLSSLFLATAVL
jgi:hypothetical protein